MCGKSTLIIYLIFKTNLQYYSNSIALFEDSDDDSIDIKVDYSALKNNAELSM